MDFLVNSLLGLDPFRILAYHSISLAGAGRCHPTNIVPVELFAEQMRMVARDFEVLGIDEMVTRLREGREGRRAAVAITFDDGYSDFLTHALPILRELGLPVALFTCCGLVGGRKVKWDDRLAQMRAPFPDEERFMEWVRGRIPSLTARRFGELTFLLQRSRPERVAEIMAAIEDEADHPPEVDLLLGWEGITEAARDPLVTLGVHSWAHDNLTTLRDEEVMMDLARCCRAIEERAGYPPLGLCYPFGLWDRRVCGLAEKAGFSYALTTDYGFNGRGADFFALRRVLVGPWSPARLARELSAWTCFKRGVHCRLPLPFHRPPCKEGT